MKTDDLSKLAYLNDDETKRCPMSEQAVNLRVSTAIDRLSSKSGLRAAPTSPNGDID
jgi:hypothetical protein